MRLLQYGVHYDELKQDIASESNIILSKRDCLIIRILLILGLEKILKWVTKKKRENCFLPRAIMTKLSATQE